MFRAIARVLQVLGFSTHTFHKFSTQNFVNMPVSTGILTHTVGYVLSEGKQMRKKTDAYQYIGSMHSVLEWQQPNIHVALCVNVNQRLTAQLSLITFDLVVRARSFCCGIKVKCYLNKKWKEKVIFVSPNTHFFFCWSEKLSHLRLKLTLNEP